MAMRYGFFDSEITGTDEEQQPIFDRAENAEFISEIFASLVTDGVYADPADNFAVQASSGMNVIIKAGKGFVHGRFAWAGEDTTLTVGASNSALPRIDTVVLRLSMTDRTISPSIKAGTPASSPATPSLTRTADVYELRLANISVAAGATSIKQADIADTRYDTSQCGIVTGVIDQIDTTGLFAQYDDQFNNWFKNLENTLDENQATNLQNNINKLDERSLSVKDELKTENLNDVQTTGIYPQNETSRATTERNYPVKASGCLVVIGYINKAYQYYICQNEGCMWHRRWVSPKWTAWEQVYPSVTSGTNENGTWVKYPDGTMICYGIKTFSAALEPGDDGTDTKAIVQQIDFPQNFSDTGYIVNATTNLDGGYTSYLGRAPDRFNDFTVIVFIMTDSRQTNASGDIRWQAIGRWK